MNSILSSGIFFVSSQHSAHEFLQNNHGFWWFLNNGNGVPTRSR